MRTLNGPASLFECGSPSDSRSQLYSRPAYANLVHRTDRYPSQYNICRPHAIHDKVSIQSCNARLLTQSIILIASIFAVFD